MSFDILWERKSDRCVPAVTVGISLYCYESLVGECLGSLLEQTLDRFDVVIVDDASTDDSPGRVLAWLKRHSTRFRRACLVRHSRNLGLGPTRNRFFELAESPFVFVLDADNLLLPACLSRHWEVAQASGADVVYGIIATFGSRWELRSATEWDCELLRYYNCHDAMALVRRQSWEECGGYRAHLWGWEDYDLWIRFCLAGKKAVRIPEILSLYRVHPNSMTAQTTQKRIEDLMRQLREDYPQFFGVLLR